MTSTYILLSNIGLVMLGVISLLISNRKYTRDFLFNGQHIFRLLAGLTLLVFVERMLFVYGLLDVDGYFIASGLLITAFALWLMFKLRKPKG